MLIICVSFPAQTHTWPTFCLYPWSLPSGSVSSTSLCPRVGDAYLSGYKAHCMAVFPNLTMKHSGSTLELCSRWLRNHQVLHMLYPKGGKHHILGCEKIRTLFFIFWGSVFSKVLREPVVTPDNFQPVQLATKWEPENVVLYRLWCCIDHCARALQSHTWWCLGTTRDVCPQWCFKGHVDKGLKLASGACTPSPCAISTENLFIQVLLL